jgi:hypothetical protein
MNVEIGAEAALFPEKEYISGILVAMQTDLMSITLSFCMKKNSMMYPQHFTVTHCRPSGKPAGCINDVKQSSRHLETSVPEVAELEWSSPHSQILDEGPFPSLLPQSKKCNLRKSCYHNIKFL